MIGFDPTPVRHPGLPVPARRDRRVAASGGAASSGDPGAGRQDGAPQKARPALRAVETAGSSPFSPSVASTSSSAGVALQSELPAPRRGLRADAGERNRFRAAYDRAAEGPGAPAARTRLERSA